MLHSLPAKASESEKTRQYESVLERILLLIKGGHES